MSTASEQSKEMAIFCQNEAKKSKRRVFKTWLEKAVLQGVMVALLAISSQSGPGFYPWAVPVKGTAFLFVYLRI